MKTLGEVLQLTANIFKDKNIERPRRTAEELLSHVLCMRRMDLYMQFDKPLQEEELVILREFVRRKAKGEPLEYILGHVFFYDCSIEVNKDVLIPRPETEILLDRVCSRLKTGRLAGKVAWDLCTGSGCLGVGLKKALPELEVVLLDLSEKALVLARRNAERNKVSVAFVQGDLLAGLKGCKADVILCNPPYVSKKEYDDLDISVRGYEPKEALVGGEDGLLFYRRLAHELPAHLRPGAHVFFEIGWNQADAVRKLFSSSCWGNICIEKDLAGHDRFFFLEFE